MLKSLFFLLSISIFNGYSNSADHMALNNGLVEMSMYDNESDCGGPNTETCLWVTYPNGMVIKYTDEIVVTAIKPE